MDRREFLQSACAGIFSLRVFPTGFEPEPDHFVPIDKKLDPAWLKSLSEPGSRRVYRGEDRGAIGMPVGGIGAGQLYLGGDGTLRDWQIFNRHVDTGYGLRNYEFRVPPRVVDHGFAVAVGDKVVRLREEDVPAVEFVGEYPLAEVRYPVADFPIDSTLTVLAPFLPLDAEASTLPATMFVVTLRNRSAQSQAVKLLSWLENATAPESGELFQGRRRNLRTDTPHGTLLTCRIEPPAATAGGAPAEVFADFEGADWKGWVAEGSAFGKGPMRGTARGQNAVTGFAGQQLVNTYNPDDTVTGTLTSPEFVIRRRFINFLIGGGNFANRTCLQLLVDARVIASATGQNREALAWAFFDVSELQGRKATLRIVDRHDGGWGHVNVDQIEFADQPRRGAGGTLAQQADFGELGVLWCDPPTAVQDAWHGEGSPLVGLGQTSASPRPRVLTRHDLTLPPGAAVELRCVLLWHAPNHGQGRWYATRFKTLHELALWVGEHRKRLEDGTRLWHRTWYDSNLPHWLLDRLHAPVANLATNTCEIWRDGRFYAWEGVGCCAGTCTHVWNYEHALARLFPALARTTRELQDFGVAFHADGLVGFRGNDAYAADGQAGTILKALREHLMAPDDGFLRRQWPRIKQATEFLIRHDQDGDGLIEDSQHNTYDINFFGANTFVGALYLAALKASERMALHMDDKEFAARCHQIAERGSTRTMERLWNGEYFVQKVDRKQHPKWQYGDGCLADQLFGQGWAHQLGLGYVYPKDAVQKAIAAVFKYCWAPDVGPQTGRHVPERYFARRGEAGLFICTWPKSAHMGEDGVRYRDEVWTGIEYQVAGHLIWEGMVQEALCIVRGVHDRYDGRKNNPWNEVECGDHYARALASWGCWTALSGFLHDGPARILGFDPRWPEFRGAFVAATGFGTFARQRTDAGLVDTLTLRHGTLPLAQYATARGMGADAARVTVVGPKGPIPVARRSVEEGWQVLHLDGVTLSAGETLTVTVARA